MREWLTIIIVFLILGILLDGIRRMRAYRKQTIRMSRGIDDEGVEGDEVPNSEFPSGGARVVAYRDSDDMDSITQSARQNYTASRQTKGLRNKLHETEGASIESLEPNSENETEDAVLNSLDANLNQGVDPVFEPSQNSFNHLPFGHDVDSSGEPSLGNFNDLDALDGLTPELKGEGKANDVEPKRMESLQTAYESPLSNSYKTESVQPKLKGKSDHRTQKLDKADVKLVKAPDLVLVINIMARRGEIFSGPSILNSFLDNGLRFGEMDIFHRHETADGKGKVYFSLANIVMPGVFNLSEMSEFETPGFSMFLSLPVSGDSLEVYELMADTAQAIALDLGGELKDENRSVMTRQTIEHDRQRVIEYERQKRLERA